ncbi:MAG TPA: MazG family protein [Syntrophobacteraceae bacterium]|nr:MazG family protein [Syntrophobacteraceae bacterium]
MDRIEDKEALNPPASPDNQWKKVRAVWEIIDRLRGESGCPWDRKQTPETVQTYLVEEAHEAAAAVREGPAGEVADELGDLLFMTLFMAHMYQEKGLFGLNDVCDLICDKMIRRHPHVFGDSTVQNAQEVRDNWEKIKANEKAASGRTPGGIPESLPALMRGYRMVSRLSHEENSPWNDLASGIKGFSVKSQALSKRLIEGTPVSSIEFGEVLLHLVNIARLKGYQAEICLHDSLRNLADS